MPHQKINDLPLKIKDSVFMDEHADMNGILAENAKLTDDQLYLILIMENDILLGKNQARELAQLLKERLKIDEQISKKIALDLWVNYFLLFQDFLGKVDDLIVQNGGVIKNLLVDGDISKKWAEYYANLAENVLSGQPFVEEEEKKEETKEESVILEKSEEQPRKELSTAEIQEKINKLSTETDLIKKINDAKELLGGLNVYGMKKTEIYDTIKQAEILAEHLGKSQNILEKRAVEDELRGMIDKIVSDIKEASAAPASAEEIQNALREIL